MRHILFVLSIIISPYIYGQALKGKRAAQQVPKATEVLIGKENKIKYMKFDEPHYKVVSNSRFLVQSLSLSDNNEFKEVSKIADKEGVQHIRLQQYYNNIPVEGKIYVVHSKQNTIKSANGDYTKELNINTTPKLTKPEAFKKGVQYFNAEKYVTDINTGDPEGELVILPINNTYILTYKFDVYSVVPLKRQYVFVDANTGMVIRTINRIHDHDRKGVAETIYSGTREITTDSVNGYFRLSESGRGNGIVTFNANHFYGSNERSYFTDEDNYWDDTSNFDHAAYQCHFATEKTYDYYLEKFDRNSIDNNGFRLVSYVHVGENYANAYWNGEAMSYGDGDGERYGPLTSVEVVAHEITHGVTQYSAGLIYQDEPGALNESFSDIFGICVDRYCHPEIINYEMGNDFSLQSNGFRNMADPNEKRDPDTYKGRYWVYGDEDHGGVHTNCGVQNYWFYLLVEGGSGINDLGNSYSVTGIGIEKAAQIAYRNLTVYLTPYSGFEEARIYSIQSATDLFGECSDEARAVKNAWYAVGVGDLPDITIASFTTSANYSCTVPATVQFKNKSRNATEWHWDFGDGGTSNQENPLHEYSSTGNYTVQLIIKGDGECHTTDTVKIENLMAIREHGAPQLPVCNPRTTDPGMFGIYKVEFGDILNVSAGSFEGNPDNSCAQITTLTEGERYELLVFTNPEIPENVKVWVDLNNDGSFDDNTECIMQSDDIAEKHRHKVKIPATTSYNIPLRMRIASDIYFKDINPCDDLFKGQYEDYSVMITKNNEAPEAGLEISNSGTKTGARITFTDNSKHTVTERKWIFEGGEPSVSTEVNPTVQYNSAGKFSVKYIVSNSYGSDTLFLNDTITVTDEYCVGKSFYTNEPEGNLYGYEGKGVKVGEYFRGVFIIDVPGADSIVVDFNDTYIGDGLIVAYYDIDVSYWDFPFKGWWYHQDDLSGSKYVSTTGGIIIEVVAEGDSLRGSDINISWRSVMGEKPKADFEMSDMAPPINSVVTFRDKKPVLSKRYFWEFEGYGSSTGKYITQRFNKTGKVKITEYVSNHYGTDSVSKYITVQDVPELSLLTDTIIVELLPGQSRSLNVEFSNNNGFGDLEIQLQPEEVIPEGADRSKYTTNPQSLKGVNVLVNTRFYKDAFEKLRYTGANCYTSFKTGSTAYEATYITPDMLDTTDVLIMGYFNSRNLIDFDYIKTWINNGGGLLLSHPNIESHAHTNSWLSDFGMELYYPGVNEELTTNITPHQITRDIDKYKLAASGLAWDATAATIKTWGNAKSLIRSSSDKTHIAYSTLGKGKIILSADVDLEMRFGKAGHTQLLRNGIKWLTDQTDWLSLEQSSLTIGANEKKTAEIEISSHKLKEGIYYAKLNVLSNDIQQVNTAVPVKLIVKANNSSIKQNLEIIQIYPNPAPNTLNINYPGFSKVEIYNLQGKLIIESTETSLDISYLPKGNYLVRITDIGGNTSTQQIVH